MEKIVIALWRPTQYSDTQIDQWRQQLLDTISPLAAGDTFMHAKLLVTDSEVAAGAKRHLGQLRPDGTVTAWFHCIEDRTSFEAALLPHCEKIHSYLVVESTPIRFETAPSAPQRCPGYTGVVCIAPPAHLPHDEFLRIWREEHGTVAIETQSTFSYIRNEVVRALTDNAPPWAAIVEEMFPIEALDDDDIFFDGQGDPARRTENFKRMFESVSRFIDLEVIDSHPMSEYRFTP